jgi:hypothetical protein
LNDDSNKKKLGTITVGIDAFNIDNISIEMLESDVDQPINIQDVKEMTSNRLVDCGGGEPGSLRADN